MSRYDWARQVLAAEGEVTDARFCRGQRGRSCRG